MRGYLLDTHALLWWLHEPEALSAEAREVIEHERNTVHLSAATGWEIGIKSAIGQLNVPNHLMQTVQDQSFVALPITFKVGLAVASLPFHHRDPFDRLMIAQALAEDLVLITRDAHMRLYDVAQLRA